MQIQQPIVPSLFGSHLCALWETKCCKSSLHRSLAEDGKPGAAFAAPFQRMAEHAWSSDCLPESALQSM